jgi:microcystin-dependent protein
MDNYIGEIRIFSYNSRIPRGWVACDGSLLAIQTNAALFSILGVQFGGNGSTTFGLPDLRGRAPLGAAGSSYVQGAAGGTNATTLTQANLQPHSHPLVVTSTVGDKPAPTNNLIATPTDSDQSFTTTGQPLVQMATSAIGNTGSNLPVSNMQPYLGVVFCIATQGVYPPRG